MKQRLLFFLAIISFFLGIMTYLCINNLIIFRGFSALRKEQQIITSFKEKKKNIILFFFKNNRITQEAESIILTEDHQENCITLINRWLSVLADESLVPFRIKLQAASVDSTGKKLILSFEQNFLNGSDSVFKKIMTIEALLKTIRNNITHIQEVYFLVNHRPLHDDHIDTSHAWPIHGFTDC